jgi:hypothetical protein
MNYSSKIDNFRKTISWTFWVAFAIAILIVFFKMSVWYQYNPPAFIPVDFLLRLLARTIINLITVWSFTMFWYLLVVAAYWYVFFKWEKYNFSFLPQPSEALEDYMNWRIVFWIMFGGLMFQAAVNSND